MSETSFPRVSVLVPCRNEEKYIARVLDGILTQDYPQDKLEVFVIDGMSDDNTTAIVKNYTSVNPGIHLLMNPDRYVSQALNLAIRASSGSVIVRMDAHSLYPVNYIRRLVEELLNYGADNTGGVWITQAGNTRKEAKAIAVATSHPFGTGNAAYRTGVVKPVFVDTVPYGCYRRDVFDRIGMFDEQLIRNQDDEFNARLRASGGKILLLPDVKITYFARENISRMASMFYQYGLFKPLVSIRIGRPATLRQLFPPGLVAGLSLTLLAGLIFHESLYLFTLLLALYLILVLYFSLRLGIRSGLSHLLIIIFPAIHFSYGWGYLTGIFRFYVLRRHLKRHVKQF